MLERTYRDRVLNAVAGEWLPTKIAVAHYTACDGLQLSVDEQLRMGRDVSRRTHETFLGLLVKMARGVGVTPWVVMPKVNQLYQRVFRGGGTQITRMGDYDVKIETIGLTLLSIPYFRNVLLGMYRGGRWDVCGQGAGAVRLTGGDGAGEALCSAGAVGVIGAEVQMAGRQPRAVCRDIVGV